MSDVATRVSAVIVDFHAGDTLMTCVESLRNNGVVDIAIVNNGTPGSTLVDVQPGLVVIEPRVNLGYGRGVNRGAAALGDHEFLLVSNPDVVVHDDAVSHLVRYLDEHPAVGLVGPQILTTTGEVYPSVRVFPNPVLAALHAVTAPWWPSNPWSARYRSPARNGRVDWVSGAFFLVRRAVFEAVGGFDESYFMFAEDMDLCWRVSATGAQIGACERSVVTHVEGLSRQREPRAMTIAHHRSAMHFEWQTARGVRRLLAPLAISLLALRLGIVLLRPQRSTN